MHSGLQDLGHSPIRISEILPLLDSYPDKVTANELKHGFQFGFPLHYSGPRKGIFSHNLISATTHASELKAKIDDEIASGRMWGPSAFPPFSNLHVSPVGLVPKADGGWRMITHLSFPPESSINSHIDNQFTSVKYTSFDQVIHAILTIGRGAFLGKMDIKSAFRLIPIRPQDFHLLGFYFEDNFYIDKCLPFGCSVSCNTFEKFSTFLEWLIRTITETQTIHHYLDDYIFISSTENTTLGLMSAFHSLCVRLGIPLNGEKTEGPATVIKYLGLTIDTQAQTISIPQDKISELLDIIDSMLLKPKTTLKDLQSLTGKLNFVSKAIRGSRAFIRRFYNAMIGLSKPRHHVRITKPLQQDLRMWQSFLKDFNGVTYFPESEWTADTTLHLFTDSAGNAQLGCGTILGTHWTFLPWPRHWANSEILRDMTFLELVPIVIALSLWYTLLSKKKLVIHTDNQALVSVINCQTSKSCRTMSLLRPMILILMKHDIIVRAIYIETKMNNVADSISRMQWSRFRMAAPHADQEPTPIPNEFQRLLYSAK